MKETLAQKRARYAAELKCRGSLITGKDLTPAQAGFRMGVLNEAQTQATIYKYNKAIKAGKTPAQARKIAKQKKQKNG